MEKNQKSFSKEKEIFKKLPVVKEKSKKTYIGVFILVFFIMYSDWFKILINQLGITVSRGVLVGVTFFNYFISLIILLFTLKDTLKRDITYYKKNCKEYFKYGISTLIVFGIVAGILDSIIFVFVGNISENQMYFNNIPLIYQIIFGAIMGPIIEECIFRGLLKKIIKNEYIFIIVSSVLFGGMHIISDLANPMNALYMITYSISGFALAYNYKKTDNLVSPIVMHFISNFTSIIL